MVVDLAPQHTRANVMLVAGVGLALFSAWGMTRPDLFERRALPIMALVAGVLFVLVALALRWSPRGLDALELEDGRLVLHERGESTAVGVAAAAAIHVVAEPLGRGHPLLCLGTRGGGLIELALMREGHIEPMALALREDLALGHDELPPRSDGEAVSLLEDGFETAGGRYPFEQIAAVDYVNHLSVKGPGLVVHRQAPAPLDPEGELDAATVMRRIADGEHVPLPDMSRSAAVLLALHIDRARTIMQG